MQHFNSKEIGKNRCFIELGFKQATCFSLDERAQLQGIKEMHNKKGPIDKGGWIMRVFWDDVAIAFQKMMESSPIQAAIKNLWAPIFLLKDCLVQCRPKHGFNGWQLATGNLMQKSFICFAGFLKQHSSDSQDVTVVSVLFDGKPLTSWDLQAINVDEDDGQLEVTHETAGI